MDFIQACHGDKYGRARMELRWFTNSRADTVTANSAAAAADADTDVIAAATAKDADAASYVFTEIADHHWRLRLSGWHDQNKREIYDSPFIELMGPRR